MGKKIYLTLLSLFSFAHSAFATSLCTFEPLELKALRARGVAIEYYPVNGQSIAELKAEIAKNGPADSSGHRRDALFSYNIEWRWPGTTSGKPNFDALEVTYKSDLVMPCWIDRKLARPPVVRKWDAYIASMVSHEAGHADIYFAKRYLVGDRIKAATRSSKLTSAQANDIGHEVIREIEHGNKAFDQENDHGKNDGVTLTE